MPLRACAKLTWQNAQFLSEQSERLAIRHPLRLRIAHWELNIGQILGLMSSSEYWQVIFAQALNIASHEIQSHPLPDSPQHLLNAGPCYSDTFMRYIGLDIGGTTTKAGLVDETGQILESRKAPTLTEDLNGFLSNLTELIRDFQKS